MIKVGELWRYRSIAHGYAYYRVTGYSKDEFGYRAVTMVLDPHLNTASMFDKLASPFIGRISSLIDMHCWKRVTPIQELAMIL